MPIRDEVREFLSLGPLPESQAAEVAHLEQLQAALFRMPKPLTDEEAAQVARMFGPDECYGLAQTLVAYIESAPDALNHPDFPPEDGYWLRDLRDRARRYQEYLKQQRES